MIQGGRAEKVNSFDQSWQNAAARSSSTRMISSIHVLLVYSSVQLQKPPFKARGTVGGRNFGTECQSIQTVQVIAKIEIIRKNGDLGVAGT